jgi:hypothetical protein
MGATVGPTQGQEVGGELEYFLGKRASISGVFEQNQPVDALSPSKASFGGDLNFRWGFK